jgi:SAM-dependent methyltransferase
METDQELFAKGLATYQKVIRHNYMAHREVYRLLHDVLVSEAPKQFVFLDIACGSATGSAQALKDTDVGGYIGVDISQPSLELAREELKNLSCQVDLRRQNFIEAVNEWKEPIHVVWIGQSLHHLKRPEKQDFIGRVRAILPPDGIFVIWEPTCLEGEDREGWMERFGQLRPEWPMVSDDEFAAFESHQRASDFAETATTWMEMGRAAGFTSVDELWISPNKLARVYRYSRQ